MSHSMSQHHSTPFSESQNHMNVLLTLTFRLRWNSTDKLPHKYTSSYQLTPLRSHFDSLLALYLSHLSTPWRVCEDLVVQESAALPKGIALASRPSAAGPGAQFSANWQRKWKLNAGKRSKCFHCIHIQCHSTMSVYSSSQASRIYFLAKCRTTESKVEWMPKLDQLAYLSPQETLSRLIQNKTFPPSHRLQCVVAIPIQDLSAAHVLQICVRHLLTLRNMGHHGTAKAQSHYRICTKKDTCFDANKINKADQ